MRKYPANSVDVIFTSPNPIRTYAQFVDIMLILGQECKRILKPTGSMWVHMEDAFNEKGSLMRWPAKFSMEMTEYDWILRAERIWHVPVGDMGYYNEGKAVDNNRLILDHCYLYHFTNARYGYYNSFEYFNKHQPCSFYEEKPERPGFSLELIKQSLLISCPPGGTVMDPFCGSATTGAVALGTLRKMDYSFVGIEIDSKMMELATSNLNKASGNF